MPKVNSPSRRLESSVSGVGTMAANTERGFFSAKNAMIYLDIGKTLFYEWLKVGIVPSPQINDGGRVKRWSRAQLDSVAGRASGSQGASR